MANFFRQSKVAGLDRLQKFAMHAHALDARMSVGTLGTRNLAEIRPLSRSRYVLQTYFRISL